MSLSFASLLTCFYIIIVVQCSIVGERDHKRQGQGQKAPPNNKKQLTLYLEIRIRILYTV